MTSVAFSETALPRRTEARRDGKALLRALTRFVWIRQVNFGRMAAASLAGIVPVYLVALFMQRRLVNGIAYGAVK